LFGYLAHITPQDDKNDPILRKFCHL